jgi:hypothetical protein
VHYIKSSESVHLTDQHEQQNATPNGHFNSHSGDVQCQNNQDGCGDDCESGFAPQQPVAIFGNFIRGEICINLRSEFVEEIVAVVGEL